LRRLHVEHQVEPQHGQQETGSRRGECMHVEAPLLRAPAPQAERDLDANLDIPGG
jgi:hypothetical protein